MTPEQLQAFIKAFGGGVVQNGATPRAVQTGVPPFGMAQAGAPVANQGMDFGSIIAQLNAPRGRHLGIGGAELTPSNPTGNFGGDPFTNGFFKPQTMRQPDVILQGSPRQRPMPQPQIPLTAGANGIPFGQINEGGMINPQLPDDQRFADNNFWSAIGSVQYPQIPQQPKKKKTPFEFGTAPRGFAGF